MSTYDIYPSVDSPHIVVIGGGRTPRLLNGLSSATGAYHARVSGTEKFPHRHEAARLVNCSPFPNPLLRSSTAVLFSTNNFKHSPLTHVSKSLDSRLVIHWQVPIDNQ
jgi:hypothetical protein